jgi:predicted nucleotidyltransferase
MSSPLVAPVVLGTPALDAQLQRFLAAHPPPGQLLLCAVTGSHLYGFSSPDSDVDLKGIHQAPTAAVLGLAEVRQNHDVLTVLHGVEWDLTTNELSQALRLLLRGNGNLLERIFSPLQAAPGPVVEELQALARDSLSRRSHGHYRGYLKGMCREHRTSGTAKSLLYSYRVALTGLHLLRTGEVLAHLPTLIDAQGLPELEELHLLHELIDVKQQQAEAGRAPEALARALQRGWPALGTALDEARQSSPLPEVPANQAEVESWLLERRTAELCGT